MAYAPQISQFSDASIPFDQAVSLCGPAAAVAFARANGRTPTLREAQEMAQFLGVWDKDKGMSGPRSQVDLMRRMGMETEYSEGHADWDRVANSARSRRPVVISTPRHYFTVSDADDQGRLFVGASGTDLIGGKEWLTPDEIERMGGRVQGAIYSPQAQSGRKPSGPSPMQASVSPPPAPPQIPPWSPRFTRTPDAPIRGATDRREGAPLGLYQLPEV